MKHSAILAILIVTALFLLFMTADPTKVPSFVLIIPFVLMYGLFWVAVKALLKSRGWTGRRSIRIGAICAALPVVLLVLQSIGQLTGRDLITILAIFALAYFYVGRMTALE